MTAPAPSPLPAALPFWLCLGTLPVLAVAAAHGGWALLLPPAFAWTLTTVLDALVGPETGQPDPQTPESALRWHRRVTLVWPPLQIAAIFGALWYGVRAEHLSGLERLGLFAGVGVVTGTVGMVQAHELLHRRSRLERWLGDLLLASVLYGHFRSEHLLVHHTWVGTPRDPVTARYNEGFYRFFARVLLACPVSAWRAERARLARAGRGPLARSNPFWRYGALQGAMLALAAALGGWQGLGLFAVQALVAIWQLELSNYVEHYGLTRQETAAGRYEPVRPHHSWNADHRVSNWLLLNLQRHSDHHTRPDRRFALLQTHAASEAPQLPMGYPAMGAMAMVPPLWRRRMNPRVRAWRRRFYPAGPAGAEGS